jgi:hypothetical protein
MFSDAARYFDEHAEAFSAVCEKLGGARKQPGDISYSFTLFDELPVWLQLWRGDDEFPAKLTLLWDKNVTQYVHYETLYSAASMLFSRLKEEIVGADRGAQ